MDKFDTEHCLIKVKVMAGLFERGFFPHLPQYKPSSPISRLWHMGLFI